MGVYPQSRDQLIERAARKAAPTLSLADAKGRDRDDYRQLFTMRAWLAGQEIRTKRPDHGQITLKKWETTAIRNQLCSCKRELGRQPEMARFDLLSADHQHAPSFEKSMDLRDAFERLQRYLTTGEVLLLATYVAHGESAVSTWDLYGRPCSYRYFCKRLHDLRDKASRFLQKICPDLVPKTSSRAL